MLCRVNVWRTGEAYAPGASVWKMSKRLRELETVRGDLAECGPGCAGETRLCTLSQTVDAMACNGDSGGPQIQRGRRGCSRWPLMPSRCRSYSAPTALPIALASESLSKRVRRCDQASAR